MSAPSETNRSEASVSNARGRGLIRLWLSLPIAVLAIAGSAAGILVDSIYSKETANWAAQGVGQDITNLIAYPALLLLALAAGRGSLRAYLAWMGVLAYSVYAYAIYAFAVHFGPLFLVDVAVFGLSIYTLGGGLLSLDTARLKASFTSRTPVRSTSIVLVAIGALFYMLWLSEIIPATIDGTMPQSLRDSGLATNPVYVLDMAVLLPAALLTGVLLRNGRGWGYCLAPVLLVCFVVLAVGILCAMAVLAVRGEAAAWGPASAIGAMAVVQLVVLSYFLRAVGHNADLRSVLRATSDSGWGRPRPAR